MPAKGTRSIAICRQCGSALAVRILSDGSVRPIGTGTTCSCGGESFDVIGDGTSETEAGSDAIADEAADGSDGPPRPRP